MVSVSRPTITVLPPASTRPSGASAAARAAAARSAAGSTQTFPRTVEAVERIRAETASRMDDQSYAGQGGASGDRPGTGGMSRGQVLHLHRFAVTPGLTLNRHPEAAESYGRTQALVDRPDSRLDVNV
jgi:hypothetical protein